MKTCDFTTTQASTIAWFRTEGILGKTNLSIKDLNKFRVNNTKWSNYTNAKYGTSGRLFSEKNNGKTAVPNVIMFNQVDSFKNPTNQDRDIEFFNNDWALLEQEQKEVLNQEKIVVRKGVKGVFQNNPELTKIGTPEQYSQYLNTIFPNSKVKDVVYHISKSKIDKFDKKYLGSETSAPDTVLGFFFIDNLTSIQEIAKEKENQLKELGVEKEVLGKEINIAIVNLQKPKTYNGFTQGVWRDLPDFSVTKIALKSAKSSFYRKESNNYFNTLERTGSKEDYEEVRNEAIKKGQDGIIGALSIDMDQDGYPEILANSIVVFEPEQIHILGSKQDIGGFKNFVNNQSNTKLYGLNIENRENLEFHVNTLQVVSQFLENVGVEQRLVPNFLNNDGSILEGAIAASNFIDGTVDIIEDLNERPAAWNKLPEEAAHFWYRLLDTNSELKDALLKSSLTDRKEAELRNSLYGEVYEGAKVIGKLELDENGEVTSKPALSPIREEAIGQLIAEAIKRIETKNGSASDYSFFKKFLEWINSLIDAFKNTSTDPFEVAAMKILSSDMSDLMTLEEYRKLNNIVNFADVLTENSVAPLDYSIIEDIGVKDSQTAFIDSQNRLILYEVIREPETLEMWEGYTMDGSPITEEKVAEAFNNRDSSKRYFITKNKVSPAFNSKEELDNYVRKTYGEEYDKRQAKIIQEVKDNEEFVNRLLNKTGRKRSKFLPKTLRKFYSIVDSMNLKTYRSWQMSEDSLKITEKLSELDKGGLIKNNDYENVVPTLKVLPELLIKYKTNPIALSEPVKLNGAKKEELQIINNIKDMIKEENPSLKTIDVESLVSEIHNWLEVNYLLGFANEKNWLGYRVDNTFEHVSDRYNASAEDLELVDNLTDEQLQRMTLEERQRAATILGLTKKNPSVFHNKISLRFNDNYHVNSHSHFQHAPSAWGNLTYFYTGDKKYKDAVLLHEIQNDNIEKLVNAKVETPDIETSAEQYLHDLNFTLFENLERIEQGTKKIDGRTPDLNEVVKLPKVLAEVYPEILAYSPHESFNLVKNRVQEKIDLYESDPSVKNALKNAQEEIEKGYSNKRKFENFRLRGGLKSILDTQDLEELSMILKEVNASTTITETQPVFLPDENHWEPGYRNDQESSLAEKKINLSLGTTHIVDKVKGKLHKLYGSEFPGFSFLTMGKPLPKAQRNPREIVRGREVITIGNTSKLLNESVNTMLYYTEKNALEFFSKQIEEAKKSYKYALMAEKSHNFNKSLSKITSRDFAKFVENYKYNNDLLKDLVEKQSLEDLEAEVEDISKLSNEEIGKRIYDQYIPATQIDPYDDYYKYKGFLLKGSTTLQEAIQEVRALHNKELQKKKTTLKYESQKEETLAKKKKLEENFKNYKKNIDDTLEVEMNYFTPLLHHMLQKHINQYGREIPMYFSGSQITMLTQGNSRTSLIYAGKEEIQTVTKEDFTYEEKKYKTNVGGFKYSVNEDSSQREISKEEYEKAYLRAAEFRAKEIKKEAAVTIKVPIKDGVVTQETPMKEALEALKDYRKKSEQHQSRVISTILNISNNKPIETGAIYNAMTKLNGVKLIWQENVKGLKEGVGGYLVDLSNYTYNVPVLYGLKNSYIDNTQSDTENTQSGTSTLKSGENFVLLQDSDLILTIPETPEMFTFNKSCF
jgi:hypothetical protein